MLTGTRPSAKRLRVFGCPIIVRHIAPRKAKLNLNTMVGTFLGYTATDKNVVYMDSVTKRFKMATHVIFDEARHTLPAAQLTPSAKALQKYDYEPPNDSSDSENLECNADEKNEVVNTAAPTPPLQVKCLSNNATMPTRATDGSTGYDLYSAVGITKHPKTCSCVPLDITIVPPIGTYGQMLSRS